MIVRVRGGRCQRDIMSCVTLGIGQASKEKPGLSRIDRPGFSFIASRLGQGLVDRCDQLSQILRGGSVYDTEQIRTLFVLVIHVGKKGFQLYIQHIGKQEQGFDAGGVGAGFEAADGFGVKICIA